MVKWCMSLCGFVFPLLLSGQLMVIPAIGIKHSEIKPSDSYIYPLSDEPYVFGLAGVEVAYGFTKSWALGLQYRYSRSTHEFPRVDDIIDNVVGDTFFGHHSIAVRSKYVLFEKFFLNAGMGFHRWDFLGSDYEEGTFISPEADTHHFIGLNVGLEYIWNKFVLGADFNQSYGFGNRASSEREWISEVRSIEIYLGYLFRFKVRSGKIWEKKCPKF